MEIYVDLLILLNLALNFCLLSATARITGAHTPLWRLGLGAALGAAYATFTVLPGLSFLGGNLWRTVFLGLMAGVSFGFQKGTVRKAVILLGLSFLLGGIAFALQLKGFWQLLLAGGCLAALGYVFWGRAMGHAGELVPVKIRLGTQELGLTALRDSGNSLKDPFTGESVLVVQGSAAQKLLGEVDLRSPAEAVATWKGAGKPRLLPYHTLGGKGMLFALRCDGVRIGGRAAGTLVAFSPEELSTTGAYEALTGGGAYG